MILRRSPFARRRAIWLVAALLAASVAFTAATSSVVAKQAPAAASAERISLLGVPNAAHVEGALYRGAQPRPEAFAELRKFGIAVVVDFRDNRDDIRREKQRVEAQGMTFVSVPWNPQNNPSRENVRSFFTALRDYQGKSIFIHCERGADRTGTMIALYRIAYDHWTPERALAEMRSFHYWDHLLPHLARYVEAFPATLAADPSLAAQAIPATTQ